ncbi:helix-turn-helix transcriptional regulator [Sphingobium sp. BHU LFT2]|uniref:helix-turn-helix transcriptional regulator n=1 Tax=Sphingobium sp. BHU LFT2 TaxID=2807634 RepID=UPI001BE8F1B8|nr:helix-turn-helix transcriptional regulator [Sphingobium sp. BHU LFT2]MBT2244544.1 helix-turn-helix transcriptional regulator [Sphingobium sp. BHU LFT2]
MVTPQEIEGNLVELLTREQVAKRLGVAVSTLDRMRLEGRIPPPVETVKKIPLYWDAKAINALLP